MMDISFSEECSEPTCEDEYVRNIDCTVLIQEEDILCKKCHLEQINQRKSLNRKSKIAATPAHKKVPVSLTSPDRIRHTQRSESGVKSIHVYKDLHDDLESILQKYLREVNEKCNFSQFMKLFITEQMKYLVESPKQTRYHPMIIKFFLGLQATSPAEYE